MFVEQSCLKLNMTHLILHLADLGLGLLLNFRVAHWILVSFTRLGHCYQSRRCQLLRRRFVNVVVFSFMLIKFNHLSFHSSLLSKLTSKLNDTLKLDPVLFWRSCGLGGTLGGLTFDRDETNSSASCSDLGWSGPVSFYQFEHTNLMGDFLARCGDRDKSPLSGRKISSSVNEAHSFRRV